MTGIHRIAHLHRSLRQRHAEFRAELPHAKGLTGRQAAVAHTLHRKKRRLLPQRKNEKEFHDRTHAAGREKSKGVIYSGFVFFKPRPRSPSFHSPRSLRRSTRSKRFRTLRLRRILLADLRLGCWLISLILHKELIIGGEMHARPKSNTLVNPTSKSGKYYQIRFTCQTPIARKGQECYHPIQRA